MGVLRCVSFSLLAVAPFIVPAAAMPTSASACHACHESDDPKRDGSAPLLSGQKRDYLVAQLHAFRAGERKHELMQAMARQLSDAEIAALADYWSARARGAATGEMSVWRATRIGVPHDFPAAYRVYKTVVEVDKGSTRQFYANRTALAAARNGVALPVGSTIVIVTYPGVIAADLAESRKPAAQGIALMSATAAGGRDVPALLRNADWRYAVFDGERVRRSSIDEAPCLACHKPRASDSFIFTFADLKQAAGT